MLKLFSRKNVFSTLGSRACSYVVLLPEDPIDTPENNSLLRFSQGEEPDFPSLSTEKCFSGMGKLSIDFEYGLYQLEEKLKEETITPTFESVMKPLDELDAQLNASWSATKILYTARQDVLPQKVYLSLHERARKARVHKFHSLPIYKACKAIKSSESETLDVCQMRVLDKFLLESRLNGIELPSEKAAYFVSVIGQLDNYKSQFRQKLAVSSSRFSYQVGDSKVLKSLPSSLLNRMSSNVDGSGPYHLTLKPDIYSTFMEHCPVRGLRWNTWQAYNMRASKNLDNEVDNSTNLENIRKCRQDQAKVLGYEDFASLSMETKMAGSTENVLSMITSLQALAFPRQMEDMETLSKFANEAGFSGDALQAYDVPYYSRLQRDALYPITLTLKEYLPFDHVWRVLLQLTSQLFGVEFEEVTETVQSKLWHQTVRQFNVIDKNGGVVSSFYLDPYQREGTKLNPSGGSGWCITLRSRSSMCTNPSSSLLFNFPAPEENQPSLLSLQDVTVLFAKFGECLHNLLTTVPYGEASGLTNVEWDAMAMTQHFMANWVYVPEVLSSLCCHHKTGETLSDAQISDVVKAANHMSAHKLCKHLYKAQLDIALHTRPEFWVTLMTELWPQFLPYQLDKNDAHVCSFSESLTDVWASAYYSHTWARVMAADVTTAFLNNSNWEETGKRFRDTFLSQGGGDHSAEIFRQFRGRDPAPSVLCELYDIDSSGY